MKPLLAIAFFLLIFFSGAEPVPAKPAGRLPQGGAQQEEMMRKFPLLEKSGAARFVNALLPVLLIAGVVAFMFVQMSNIDPPFVAMKIFLSLYVLVGVSEVIWLLHLFKDVPLWGSVEREFGLLLGGGSVLIAAYHGFGAWFHWQKELHAMPTQICGSCRQAVAKILTVCPYCNNPL